MDYAKQIAKRLHNDTSIYEQAASMDVAIIPNEYGFDIFGKDKKTAQKFEDWLDERIRNMMIMLIE